MRTIVVGGPRCGKSTLAREHRSRGIPTFCGDPLSTVKEPEEGVTYLPEGIPFSGDDGAAVWICNHWLTMAGPWCIEGHVMARALRRWTDAKELGGLGRQVPADWRVIVLPTTHEDSNATPRQISMGIGVMTVWRKIQHRFVGISEER